MKKFSCILLVLLLVIGMLPMYACAEETTTEEPFTMRCGIQFGDSMETVLEKDTLFASGPDSQDSDSVSKENVTVADVSSMTVNHIFNDNGLYLTSYSKSSYYFDMRCTQKITIDYDRLIHQLTEKYGEPETHFQNSKTTENEWIIFADDGSAVTIFCRYQNSIWEDGPKSTYFGETEGKKTTYGYESIYWTYKYYTPEEAESLKAVNDEV